MHAKALAIESFLFVGAFFRRNEYEKTIFGIGGWQLFAGYGFGSSSVSQDGFLIRRTAAEHNISCFTSLDTAKAMLRVVESLSFTTISMNELEG